MQGPRSPLRTCYGLPRTLQPIQKKGDKQAAYPDEVEKVDEQKDELYGSKYAPVAPSRKVSVVERL